MRGAHAGRAGLWVERSPLLSKVTICGVVGGSGGWRRGRGKAFPLKHITASCRVGGLSTALGALLPAALGVGVVLSVVPVALARASPRGRRPGGRRRIH